MVRLPWSQTDPQMKRLSWESNPVLPGSESDAGLIWPMGARARDSTTQKISQIPDHNSIMPRDEIIHKGSPHLDMTLANEDRSDGGIIASALRS